MGCCSTKSKSNKKLSQEFVKRKTRKEYVIKQSNFVVLIHKKITEDYELLSTLGQGGFGEVKLGKNKTTNQERAIKTILLESSKSTNIEKLIEEVNILKKLDHPNIVKVFEVYQDDLYLNIVMELCTGRELFNKIRKSRSFSENQAAKYMFEIVSAVKYCHASGIVHRDLKPENILLENKSPDAKLKLIDFGTSHFLKPHSKLSKMIGTSYYMAPEVISGSYDMQCDVWSLGIILYIMLSGLPPFYAKDEKSLYKKIRNKPVSFKKPVWSNVSKEAKELIRWMLNKSPAYRPKITDILDHEWIKTRMNNSVPDISLASESLSNLKLFNVHNKLQKATMTFIVSQIATNTELRVLREVFLALDVNKDGTLSKGELINGLSKFSQTESMNANELMQKCDIDQNGLISYTEFLTAATNWKTALNKDKLYKAFQAFDMDRNGKISLEELWQRLGGDEYNYGDFTKMLKAADVNGDGEIDFEEFTGVMIRQLESDEEEPNQI
ncbi:unnamed protein product [Blepharisma stoltei]|uniref:non-specific serine/threonine protein kinase n=1 Tax=Blepharisma stoltei TaxID=1481888 RepID=A0AAU9K3X8_9CILI|nr:unnamed protein product [Blepharisma stoltei]